MYRCLKFRCHFKLHHAGDCCGPSLHKTCNRVEIWEKFRCALARTVLRNAFKSNVVNTNFKRELTSALRRCKVRPMRLHPAGLRGFCAWIHCTIDSIITL